MWALPACHCDRKYQGDPHKRGCLYFREPATIPAPAYAPPKRCECGADSAGCGGGGAHSDWCPKGAGK